MVHDPERFDEMVAPHARALGRMVEAHQEVVEDRQLTPWPDAPIVAQIQQQSRWGIAEIASTPVDQALSIGMQYSIAGCDHFRAICTLVTAAPAVLFSDKVLLRAGIEAMARSAWLFELSPTVDARERARRGLNERLHQMCRNINAIQQNRRLLEDDVAASKLERLKERRDAMLAGAAATGIGEPSGPDRFGHYRIGAPRPTATAVLGHLLNRNVDDTDLGAVVQGAYSEFVHSNLAALRHQAVIDEAVPPAAGDLQLVPYASSAGDVMFTIELAGGALLTAAGDMRATMGWTDDAAWNRTVLDALAVLKVAEGLASEPHRPPMPFTESL